MKHVELAINAANTNGSNDSEPFTSGSSSPPLQGRTNVPRETEHELKVTKEFGSPVRLCVSSPSKVNQKRAPEILEIRRTVCGHD